MTAAMLAAANGHESTAQLFFSDGRKPEDSQRMMDIIALRRATIEGEADTVQRILAIRDFPFNLLDLNGCDPFLHAVEKGHAAIVKMFLSLGKRFDINRIYHYSCSGLRITSSKSTWPTAIIVATLYGHEEIVRLLLERDGMDINAKIFAGNTCNWGKQGNSRMTALDIAESKGFTQIIELLRAKINPI
jgi:ankyrin repeat protein